MTKPWADPHQTPLRCADPVVDLRAEARPGPVAGGGSSVSPHVSRCFKTSMQSRQCFRSSDSLRSAVPGG